MRLYKKFKCEYSINMKVIRAREARWHKFLQKAVTRCRDAGIPLSYEEMKSISKDAISTYGAIYTFRNQYITTVRILTNGNADFNDGCYETSFKSGIQLLCELAAVNSAFPQTGKQ